MQKRSVNKVILVGRVGLNPEISYSKSKLAIARYSIATNETKSNSDGNKTEHAEWHHIVSLGKQAEFIREYVKKGQLIYVEGKLKTQKWEDKNNLRHYKTEIISDSVTPLEWKFENNNITTDKNEDELPF